MTTTSYTFLPWARRGLAGRTAGVTSEAPLPAQATVDVGLTLTSLPESRFELTLHGPGDVLGIDPRLIVRTDPRPYATAVEPNYLPLIEFDPPDLPWLFTPASSGPDDRLRPWCVLIVVDLSVVAAPHTEPGRPLPVVEIPAAVAAAELPDLAESWVWAHAQLIAPDGEDPAAALGARPAMNVSRLLAPRRLRPDQRYAACLVPAFDAGVARGLGGEPAADGPLAPAWPTPPTGDVLLPVYHHWEFSTGATGDFEELARRITPFPVPAGTGGEPLFLGAAGPELPPSSPADPTAYVQMDGALRAWQGSPGTLADVPDPVRTALQATLDAAGEQAVSGPSATTPVLGPPLYGAWPARQHTVPAASGTGAPGWLRELNLDPRTRAAAALGAEIVRQNQDQFVQWCWEQVEEVLEANVLLSRARLSMEALSRVHAKHLAPLPQDRLLQVTAPMHSRTRNTDAARADLTISASIDVSSMPNAASDPALRRLTSPQRPVLRTAIARADPAAGPVVSPRVALVGRLSVPGGGLAVDPTDFVPHGLLGIPAMASVPVDPSAETVDLSAIGMPVLVPRALVEQVRDDTAVVTADPHPRITDRADLAAGILGARHIQDARDLQVQFDSPWYSVFDLFVFVQPADRITDPATIQRLGVAVAHVGEAEVVVGAPPPPFVALGMNTVGQSLLARTDPRGSVPARLASMVSTGTAGLLGAPAGPGAGPAPGVRVAPPSTGCWSGRASASRCTRTWPGWTRRGSCPASARYPTDSITLLETNPRFVEALLVGANHEMNRELLWRGLPDRPARHAVPALLGPRRRRHRHRRHRHLAGHDRARR